MNQPLSDAEILKPIQLVNEANRKARHAIRKAFETARDHVPAVIEGQSLELQSFTNHMAERAAKGFDRL